LAKIIVHSKKYGEKIILIDKADFEQLKQYSWYVDKVKNKFYATRSGYPGSPIRMHRVIMGVSDPKIQVDHRDKNGLNNKRSNLRLCTNRQNSCNKIAIKNRTSKYLGVWFNKRKGSWKCEIMKDGKKVYSRSFKTEDEAALAYNRNAPKFHGEFVSLNIIP